MPRGGSRPGERRGGRQKGTPNKASASIRARIEKEADPIGFLTQVKNGEAIKAGAVKEGGEAADIIPTLDQRMSAAQFLARRISPEAKSAHISFELPKIEKTEDMAKATAAILHALAEGQITPDEAAAVASIVETHRKTIETVDIEERLRALEAAQK